MKIKLNNISKKFSNIYALQDVDLTFEKGNFYGILGPNGAGKSTLINIIIGNISSDQGNCEWLNEDGKLSQLEIKHSLGVVFQDNLLDPLLTVHENLISRGKMYGMSKKLINDKIDSLNKYINIKSILKKRYSDLSGGQKRKCEVIRALLNSPEVLILDEPTTGLDPQTRSSMWKAINNIHKESNLTVILVTHYLEEMNNCDQISVILKGKIYYKGSIDSFIKKNSKTKLLINLNNISDFSRSENILDIEYKEDFENKSLTLIPKDTSETIKYLYEINKIAKIKDFQVYHASLERAYLNLLNNEGCPS